MTPKQLELLRFIRNSVVHHGDSPSYRQMREHMKVTSNQTVIDWLVALEKQGYLIWEKGKTRGIKVKEKAIDPKEEFSLQQIPPTSFLLSQGPTTASGGVYNHSKHIGNGITLQVDNDLLLQKGGEREGTS